MMHIGFLEIHALFQKHERKLTLRAALALLFKICFMIVLYNFSCFKEN